MPTDYPDRRSRYAGTLPWEVATIKESTRTVRGPSPSDGFRVVTREIPPQTEEPAPQVAEEAPNPIPSESDTSLDPPFFTKPLPLDSVESDVPSPPDDSIA